MHAVLVEIANNTTLCTLSKQSSCPTNEDKLFAKWLYKGLKGVVKVDRSE